MLNESKILHLDEMEEFFGSEEWKLQIDITDIWNQYTNKNITIDQFNQEYAKRLNGYKEQILGLGNDVWNELVPYINDVNSKKTYEESIDVYENIYDWGDKHDILIKTK